MNQSSDLAYTVKRLGPHVFVVAKFGDGAEPLNEYYVTINDRQGVEDCDCMGYKRYPKPEHKHLLLVRRWLSDGEPMMQFYRLDRDNNPRAL